MTFRHGLIITQNSTGTTNPRPAVGTLASVQVRSRQARHDQACRDPVGSTGLTVLGRRPRAVCWVRQPRSIASHPRDAAAPPLRPTANSPHLPNQTAATHPPSNFGQWVKHEPAVFGALSEIRTQRASDRASRMIVYSSSDVVLGSTSRQSACASSVVLTPRSTSPAASHCW